VEPNSLRKDALKALLFAALSLFVVPLAAFLFTEHAQADRDALYTASLIQSVERDAGISPEEKQNAREFFTANPPSAACDSDSASLAEYRSAV